MKRIALLSGLALSVLLPASAFATVDMTVFGGVRTAKPQPDSQQDPGSATPTFAGSDYGASANLVPFDGYPVAIGVFGSTYNLKGQSNGLDVTVGGFAAGPQLKVWLPLGQVRPFLQAGYIMHGSHTYTVTAKGMYLGEAVEASASLDSKLEGVRATVGTHMVVNDRFSLYAAADFAKETWTPSRATTQGITRTVRQTETRKQDSTAIQAGIAVSI